MKQVQKTEISLNFLWNIISGKVLTFMHYFLLKKFYPRVAKNVYSEEIEHVKMTETRFRNTSGWNYLEWLKIPDISFPMSPHNKN